LNTLSLSRLESKWANTIRVNAPSVSHDARTAQPDEPANIGETQQQTAPKPSPQELALLQLRDTIAMFDALQFRSMLDLFKSIPSGIQDPPARQVAEAYKNQMALQK